MTARDEADGAEARPVPFGPYHLIKRLARGGMAEIFLAVEHGIEGVRRQVVVKRILPQMAESDDFVTMFMDEARVVALMSHPNVVHIYNFGEVDGIYFIAMEHVNGVTLSRLRRLARPEPLPIELALRVTADVCAGLHHAHEMRDGKGQLLGVVHRDISPQNIMVTRDGVSKVIDFGIARATTQAHSTQAGQVKGKFGYIAPEQFRGKSTIDRRSDIFAVGTVLYELITGERLFVRESEAATLSAIMYDDPPSVTELRKGAPAMIDALIARAVQKNPDDRYQTMAEMQQAIEELIVRRAYIATSFVIAQFVQRQLEKDQAARGAAEARLSAEAWLPSSYDTQQSGVQSRQRLRSSSGSLLRDSLELTPPDPVSYGSVPSQPGLTGATPVAPRQSRGLWIAIALVAVALVLAVGVATGLAMRLAGNEQPLVATNEPSDPPDPIKTFPVEPAPTDLIAVPKSGPDRLPLDDPTTPQPDASPAGQPAGKATPAKAKKVVVAPRETGTLFLNARPWCKVSLGGRNLGNTPLLGVQVPAGTHTLQLIDANGERHARRVVIRPGEPTKLNLVLDGD